ncbi:MAG: DUF3379 family protein [Pseudohongiellaceae bacterium]
MDKEEFVTRVFANPYDEDPDFLDASKSHSERQTLINEVRAFDRRMRKTMHEVPIPDGLANRLKSRIHGEVSESAKNSNWFVNRFVNRWYAMAAVLVLTVGLTLSAVFIPSGPTETEVAMGQGIIRHVIAETADFTGTDSVNFSRVNQVMATVGGRMQDNALTRELNITFAKQCLVLPGEIGAHFVMRGDEGVVNIIIMQDSLIDREFEVEDDRFSGMASPMGSGSVILIGDSMAGLENYRNMLAANIDWSI